MAKYASRLVHATRDGIFQVQLSLEIGNILSAWTWIVGLSSRIGWCLTMFLNEPASPGPSTVNLVENGMKMRVV